jgi:hypothetical protein
LNKPFRGIRIEVGHSPVKNLLSILELLVGTSP